MWSLHRTTSCDQRGRTPSEWGYQWWDRQCLKWFRKEPSRYGTTWVPPLLRPFWLSCLLHKTINFFLATLTASNNKLLPSNQMLSLLLPFLPRKENALSQVRLHTEVKALPVSLTRVYHGWESCGLCDPLNALIELKWKFVLNGRSCFRLHLFLQKNSVS